VIVVIEGNNVGIEPVINFATGPKGQMGSISPICLTGIRYLHKMAAIQAATSDAGIAWH
jgi:hypothetical protein